MMANLQYFKCKGSFGIHYGLGLDEIAVNFENVSGLVNLAGNNGHGKTTFMEMLSPFPVFPSRQQKNPQKYSFKKQFRLRDSYKEVCYLYQGKRYVFRVEIPAGTTMSPEGYITCDGVPLVKGKITEYKKVVSELFGSEKLFYSSIFSCQGGQKLTDLTVGDFKQLLIELLGLKRYVEYYKNTGDVITECKNVLDSVLRGLEIYSAREQEIEKNKQVLESERLDLESKQIEITALEDRVKITKENIDILAREKAEVEKTLLLISEKEKQLDKMCVETAEFRKQIEKVTIARNDLFVRHSEKTHQWHDIITKKQQIITAAENLATTTENIKEMTARLNTLVDNGSKKKEQISRFDLEIAGQTADLKAIENDPDLKKLIDDQKSTQGLIDVTAQKIDRSDGLIEALKKDPETKALERELEQFDQAEQLLSKRPGLCTIDDCPFIKNALEKVAGKPSKIKEIEESRKQNDARIKEEMDIHDALTSDKLRFEKDFKEISEAVFTRRNENAEAMEDIKTALKKITEGRAILISQRDTMISDYKTLSADILAAENSITELRQLAEKKPELETAEKLLEQSVLTFNQESAQFKESEKNLTEKADNLYREISVLEREIKEMQPERSLEEIEELEEMHRGTLIRYEGGLKQFLEEKSVIEKTIAVLEDKASMSEKDAAEISRLRSRESFIREELSRWAYIRDAVSKSGLQALEISAAAPLLTSIANDLLHSAYGGEFYLDLITQDPETGAEILDIMITRGDGETYSLCDFSGGESVWVLQAFKAAQILVNAEKSGVHFATCFADEESGALDKEKAEKFIMMYRALMNQGNFEKLFFISHIPECQAMADHSLVFQQGGIVSESDIRMVA